MFTTLQKYQKAFLVFITVLLTAAFGLGGVCFTIFDPQNFNTIATMGEYNKGFSSTQFDTSKAHWRGLYRFAKKMSPKAKLSLASVDRQDYQAYMFQMQSYITGQMMLPPIWDDIYSLSDAVLQVDSRIDKQLESASSMNAQQMLQRKIDAYLNLPEEDKKQVEKELTEQDIWKCLMLLEEAKKTGIRVSDEEIEKIVKQTITVLDGKKNFNSELSTTLLMRYNEFKSIIRDALFISKLISTKTSSIKVTTKEAYESIKNDYTKYKVDYVTLNTKKFIAEKDYLYRQERTKFFDKKQEISPEYFTIPGQADFEYVYASEDFFINKVVVSDKEVETHASENMDLYQDSEDQDIETILAVKKETIAQDLRTQKVKKLTQQSLSKMRNALSTLKGKVNLSNIAKEYGFTYGQHENVSADDYLDLKDVGTTSAKNQIYQELSSTEFSRIFPGRTSGYFFVRLGNLNPSRQLTKEEMEIDDEKFLRRYYENNKWQFTSQDTYKLGYIIADYSEIEKTLIPTTSDLKQFYETYKEQLYKTTDGYKDFTSVKKDLESRAFGLLRTRILQKVHIVQKKCKSLGQETNIGLVVQELGNRIGLKYVESKELQTVEQIKEENVVDDKNFAPNLNADTKVSDVVDSDKGKYFYIVLEHKNKSNDQFENVKQQVKEKFLEEQSLNVAKEFAQEFSLEYNSVLLQAKTAIEKSYESKIVNAINSENIVAQKKEELDSVAQDVLHALSLKYDLAYKTSPLFSSISNVPELKNSYSSETEIKKLQLEKISNPVEDNNKSQIYLFLLTQKRIPELKEIPQTQVVGVQQGIWQQQYNKKLQEEYLNYKKLAENLKLQIEDEFIEINEEDEEDILSDENL